MRVQHLTWDIHHRIGGGERASLAIARATCGMCESSLWSVGCGPNEFYRDGMIVRRIPRLFGSFDNPFPNPKALAKVIRSADIIHVHQMNTYLLDLVAAFKRQSQVLVVTDYGGGGISVGRFFKFFNQVDAFTSYSSEMNRLSYKNYTNVWQLPIPINLPRQFHHDRSDKLAPGHQRIVTVGRILPHKGFEVVISAMSTEDSLTIVGVVEDQPYYEWLLSLPTNGTVTFLHDADDNQLIDTYLNADVFVSTSVPVDYRGNKHPKSELLSLVAIEAAWYGLPVVISSIAPALQREITAGIVPGNIYEAGSVSELKTCLDRWRGPKRRSLNSAEYIQNRYGDSTVGTLYHDFYSSLILNKRKKSSTQP